MLTLIRYELRAYIKLLARMIPAMSVGYFVMILIGFPVKLFEGSSAEHENPFMIFTIVLVTFAVDAVHIRDATPAGRALFLSLPYNRTALLQTRYVTAGVLCMIVILWSFLLLVLTAATIPAVLGDELTFRSQIINSVVLVLMLLCALPAATRFSFSGGSMIGLLIFVAVMIPIVILFSWLDPDGTVLSVVRGISDEPMLRRLTAVSIALVGLAVCTVMSFRVSKRILVKKEF